MRSQPSIGLGPQCSRNRAAHIGNGEFLLQHGEDAVGGRNAADTGDRDNLFRELEQLPGGGMARRSQRGYDAIRELAKARAAGLGARNAGAAEEDDLAFVPGVKQIVWKIGALSNKPHDVTLSLPSADRELLAAWPCLQPYIEIGCIRFKVTELL
ncbi:hypothetical protein [Sphingomonas koreensis]